MRIQQKALLPRNVPKRWKCQECNFTYTDGRNEDVLWQHFLLTGGDKAGHMSWTRWRGHRLALKHLDETKLEND